MTLFLKEASITGNFISLSRDLSFDDFDIRELNNTNNRKEVTVGIVFSIKQKVIDDLINAVDEDGSKHLLQNREFSSLCVGHSNEPLMFYKYCKIEVKYNGLKTQEAKDKKFEDSIKKCQLLFEEKRTEKTTGFLGSIQKRVISVIDNNNKLKERDLEKIILSPKENLSDSFSEDFFSNEKINQYSSLEKSLENIEKEMKALKLKSEEQKFQQKKMYIQELLNLDDSYFGPKTRIKLEESLSK